MVLLGLLLVIAGSAAVAIVIIQATATEVSLTVLDRAISMSAVEIFGAGAATLAAFAVGLTLIAKGLHRHLALRLDLRRTRRQARESLAQLHEAKQARARQAGKPAAAPEHTEAPSGTHPDDRLVAGHRRPVTS